MLNIKQNKSDLQTAYQMLTRIGVIREEKTLKDLVGKPLEFYWHLLDNENKAENNENSKLSDITIGEDLSAIRLMDVPIIDTSTTIARIENIEINAIKRKEIDDKTLEEKVKRKVSVKIEINKSISNGFYIDCINIIEDKALILLKSIPPLDVDSLDDEEYEKAMEEANKYYTLEVKFK